MPPGRPNFTDATEPSLPTLEEQLTERELRGQADTRSFAAGEDYYRNGLVRNLVVFENRVTATVQGTHKYRVKLTAKPRGLDYDCSCPYASEEGAFCKHCVAVGLAYQREHLGLQTGKASTPPSGSGNKTTLADLKTWLSTRTPDEMIALILDHATDDADWRNRLFLRVASDAKTGVNMGALRKIIQDATRAGGFIEYGEVDDFVSELDEVAETLRRLISQGSGKAVQELALFAVDQLTTVTEEADDSNGEISGTIKDFIEIHRDACLQSPPDPRQLAQELYKREVNDSYELWEDTPELYADVLGKVGQTEFRNLLQADWAALPNLTHRTGGSMRWDSRRYRITSLMESLARAAGDLEALLAVLRKDLSSANQYLRIATLLKEAKRFEESLHWAERGIQDFAPERDGRLDEFLVAEYQRRGDHDKALEILWNQFLKRPALAGYRALREYTEPIGGWQAWRENALAHLQEKITQEKNEPKPTTPFYSRSAQTKNELIAIYLWENDADAAWKVAQAEDTTDDFWKQIAFAREATHPADSISVYRRLIPPLIEPVTNGQYDQPVTLIEHVRNAMRLLGQDTEYREYVQELRTTFKRKRNFLNLLEKRGL